MTKPRILIIDIETAPLELYGWSIYGDHVNYGLDQIKADWSILSYAAKWLDEPTIFYEDTGGRGKKNVRHDRRLMKGLWKLLDEADIIVAQNGQKFDVRKMNARFIVHGFSPPSPYKVVDTMLAARKYFAFTSQKLKYTSETLGVPPKDEHEEYPGFKLWLACLEDEAGAWAVMKRYNIRDITATEHVYKRLRPWINNHPNLGAYVDSEKPICPHCGSENVIGRNGWRIVKQQGAYKRYWCKDCHGWARGKIMQLPLSKRRSMLAPE